MVKYDKEYKMLQLNWLLQSIVWSLDQIDKWDLIPEPHDDFTDKVQILIEKLRENLNKKPKKARRKYRNRGA